MIKTKRLPFFVFILVLLSCGKTEQPDIPSRPVNLTIHLGDKDKELNSILASKIYTEKDINTSLNERAGFGGVLVYHSSNGFLAFDAACPYEIDQNTRIKVDSNAITATCPKCGSTYSLDAGGVPISGPSSEYPERKRLRQFYNVAQLSGNKIQVWN